MTKNSKPGRESVSAKESEQVRGSANLFRVFPSSSAYMVKSKKGQCHFPAALAARRISPVVNKAIQAITVVVSLLKLGKSFPVFVLFPPQLMAFLISLEMVNPPLTRRPVFAFSASPLKVSVATRPEKLRSQRLGGCAALAPSMHGSTIAQRPTKWRHTQCRHIP